MTMKTTGMGAAAWLLAIGMAAAAPAPDSKRMGRAKDFIADEQWSRAIVELQAAVADPKESNHDEALFWLAHSQHQSGDDAAALQSIATLERTAPKSPWVKLARSLRIEIAQQLGRDDVLRMMVAPPAPPAPPRPPGMTPAAAPPTLPPRRLPPPRGAAARRGGGGLPPARRRRSGCARGSAPWPWRPSRRRRRPGPGRGRNSGCRRPTRRST